MPNYANPVRAFIDWLVVTLPVGPAELSRRAVPEMPDDLVRAGIGGSLPCHVVTRIGGSDPLLGLDVVRLNVDTYALGPDPMQAQDAVLERAEDIRRAVRLVLPGKRMGGIWVNRTSTETAPTIRPYDSRNQIRKAQAAYGIWCRGTL